MKTLINAGFSAMLFFAATGFYAPCNASAMHFERGRLAITSSNNTHYFNVEIASTGQQHQRGLMYRKALLPNTGMLFIFPHEQEIMMWMKNTRISLDMIFIDRNGVVAAIHPDAKPLSTELISSNAPAIWTLEVPAGTAKRLGVSLGHKVSYQLLP